MKLVNPWMPLALACCSAAVAPAQLELVPDQESQQVFAGDARKVAVVWHNAGNQPVKVDVHTRVFQTSSATTIPLGGSVWKELLVLPGQTVLESARLDFPVVRTETRFLVQWLAGSNQLLGVTAVLVYPTNLLEGLRSLADGKAIGIFNPQGGLKPLLKNSNVDFVDLGASELEHFPGSLVVIGPFASKTQVPDGLAKRIKVLAQKGVGVVWIQPPEANEKLQPSFYLVPEFSGVVVVAQAALVSGSAADPKSQLNLLYFCDLALHPQFLTLPGLSPEP